MNLVNGINSKEDMKIALFSIGSSLAYIEWLLLVCWASAHEVKFYWNEFPSQQQQQQNGKKTQFLPF